VTKRNDADDANEVAQVVMQLAAGKYFGEGALIQYGARKANVVATSAKLKCLYISKEAFEEVLGPLQDIIDDDRKAREKIALTKQLQAESEGLASVAKGDFSAIAVASTFDSGVMGVAKHKTTGRDYTIKVINKTKASQLGSAYQGFVMKEMSLASGLVNHSAFVPVSLGFFMDEASLYTIFKIGLVADIAEMLETVTFDEAIASFYIANILLAIEHLHAEGICYRNISPDNLYVDAYGFVQLCDLKYAVKMDVSPPRDYCGVAWYLSPEQVAGQGHSFPVDLWALGILAFEMLTRASPWHSENDHENNEVGFYSKITNHAKGKLNCPQEFSSDLKDLLNDLLDPTPDSRIGCRGAGFEELRLHQWFVGIDMKTMLTADHSVPYHAASFAKKRGEEIRKTGPGSLFNEPPYEGDAWFADWGSGSFSSGRK